MQSLIFIIYLLLCCRLITKLPFFTKSGISKWMLVALFLSKIAAGFAYAWFFSLPQNIATADTWKFYNASFAETAWLLRDPAGFVQDYFHSPYQQASNLFSGTSSYWNDLDYNTIVKGIAVVNVMTGKSYYADLLLFNFMYLCGPVALFRLLLPEWKYNTWWLVVPVFFMPSFLFWCSGLHKDGLIFSALLLSIYSFQKIFVQHNYKIQYILIALLCFTLLFALRNVMFLLLLPALAAFFLATRKPDWQGKIFAGIYTAGLLLFFISPLLSSKLDFPHYIVSKQAEFNLLTGNSKVILPLLQTTFISFIKFFPYAVDLVFFRPHLSELRGVTYIMTFLENWFLIALATAWLFFHKPFKTMNPLVVCLLFFSFSILLLCGYTVTFISAIARYKSIIIPLLASCLSVTIDYKKPFFTKLIK